MQEYYRILGVDENANIEEIESAYEKKKAQYSKERFLEGEQGNEAAKNLTMLETAYAEIKSKMQCDGDNDYKEIEKLLKQGELAKAQEGLDSITCRDAEWHYLQAVVFYKKNWINESKKQLEIAMSMDASNKKYSESYYKLKEKISFNERQFHSGNAGNSYSGESGNPTQQPQMGGDGLSDCCSWCATMCCMNMACNMCCRC